MNKLNKRKAVSVDFIENKLASKPIKNTKPKPPPVAKKPPKVALKPKLKPLILDNPCFVDDLTPLPPVPTTEELPEWPLPPPPIVECKDDEIKDELEGLNVILAELDCVLIDIDEMMK